jgi:hypothetical protein
MASKRIVGLVPKLPFIDAGAAGLAVKTFQRMKRALYHKYMALVLQEMEQYSVVGIWLTVGDKVLHFYPILSVVINDHPEGELLALHKDGSWMSCRRCITTKEDLHAFTTSLAADRVSDDMQENVESFNDRFAAARSKTPGPGGAVETVEAVEEALRNCKITNSLHLEKVGQGGRERGRVGEEEE